VKLMGDLTELVALPNNCLVDIQASEQTGVTGDGELMERKSNEQSGKHPVNNQATEQKELFLNKRTANIGDGELMELKSNEPSNNPVDSQAAEQKELTVASLNKRVDRLEANWPTHVCDEYEVIPTQAPDCEKPEQSEIGLLHLRVEKLEKHLENAKKQTKKVSERNIPIFFEVDMEINAFFVQQLQETLNKEFCGLEFHRGEENEFFNFGIFIVERSACRLMESHVSRLPHVQKQGRHVFVIVSHNATSGAQLDWPSFVGPLHGQLFHFGQKFLLSDINALCFANLEGAIIKHVGIEKRKQWACLLS